MTDDLRDVQRRFFRALRDRPLDLSDPADEALYECKDRGRNQSLLNVGNGAFLAPPGVPRQESSTTVARPVFE